MSAPDAGGAGAKRVPPVPADASVGAAVDALWQLTLLLRRECPWDVAQTALTIVPHTLEEAYEVASAARRAEANSGAVVDLVDELGDLLFQVTFLAMWCAEQQPDMDLRAVADAIRTKLVRRHPHIFGDSVAAADPDAVREAWDTIKRDVEGAGEAQRGVFAGVSDGLPSLQLATKLQGRAAKVGFDFADARAALAKVDEELEEVRAALTAAEAAGVSVSSSEASAPDPRLEQELGDLCFAVVNVARLVRVDPDLALQGSAERFRTRVTGAEQLADEAGQDFASLSLEQQEQLYQQVKAAT